jgi:hypothetical protein
MLMRKAELDAIRTGAVDLAFRRWKRPRVLAGTRMRTAIGLVEVTAVDEVDIETITEDDARRAGARSRERLLTMLARHEERGAVHRVTMRFAGPDPRIALREDAALSDADRAELDRRLARYDQAARDGAWTSATLAIIARRPAVRAPDLAAELGRETREFKRDVRKLKELGLTESLDTGYRLSPRGRAFLERDAS